MFVILTNNFYNILYPIHRRTCSDFWMVGIYFTISRG